jgi:isoleucyl-tRNA synthetase
MASTVPNNPSETALEKSEVALREEAMLAFWNENDIFKKSLEKKSPKGDFVFYDGPPFATGLPHYGHILASTIKDAIPRYKTMQGYHVERRWGWDCHGLPLENIIEKRLGLATKRDIEELGVKTFNETARDAVLEYADDWRQIIPRMGRWVDMENDYKTMDTSYTESVWHVFHSLYKKGLVYEGFKSMHLCPRCGTTLSNFEVNQGYKDIKDIAVTVKLPLVDEPSTSLLVWTTTPWTLPGNMAAAVHKDHIYVKVRKTGDDTGEHFILAKERLAQLGTDEYEVVGEMRGEELVGKSYIPPFPYLATQELKGKEHAWKIYHADYVTLGEEGTGAVHLAPAYGEEDMVLAQKEGVPIFHHVGEDGRFLPFVTDFAGRLVKPKDDDDAGVTHLDADIEVVKALAHSGRLVRKENITHSYPHCWRCDTPLLNYATTSWFVEATKIKNELISANATVSWVPDHVGSARFGKWLEGVRDWAISRQRYWGAPLPIWKHPVTHTTTIIGSREELRTHTKRSGNTYLFIRHGQAESNVQQYISSHPQDVNHLTEEGREQVVKEVQPLKGKKVTKIICSPLMRTRETAELVAREIGFDPAHIEVDDRLKEWQLGTLSGESVEKLRIACPTYDDRFYRSCAEGAETLLDMKRRVGDALYEYEKKYAGETILIIGHEYTLWLLACVARGATVSECVAIRGNEPDFVKNGEVRTLEFVPIPHNDNYEFDFHRPYIDDVEVVNDKGDALVRIPDVFDCWFESGSMPFGQQHYPFENIDTFNPEKGVGYPAQFIAEGLDQTRGWFYSLLVLGTALFGKSPYEHVIVNGLVLAEDGKKMSKKLQNYPDPVGLVDRLGADSMRYYLLASPIVRGEDLNFSEKNVGEIQRKNIGRLHNVLTMYELYADTTQAEDSASTHVLDAWIRARVDEVVRDVTSGFESYELDRATRPLTDLIDDVSVWYVRRSRDRFKGDDANDKQRALGTLKYVLKTIALLGAPSMPFYAEYLYQRVRSTKDPESVHLADWPVVAGGAATNKSEFLEQMRELRDLSTLILEARQRAGIKVRQPLQKVTLKSTTLQGKTELLDILADEVNVKEVVFGSGFDEKVLLDTKLTDELIREGDVRELIRAVQDMRKQALLAPADRIVLTVSTNEVGKSIVHDAEHMLRSVAGVESVRYEASETPREVRIRDTGILLSLTIV